MRSAVDVENVSGDGRRVGEVHDGVGDLFDRGDATHWREGLHDIAGGVVMKGSGNDAGRDGVHANAVFRILHREMLRDRFEPAFGDHRHGRRETSDRITREGRGYRHDTAARLLREHLLDYQLGNIKEALDVC